MANCQVGMPAIDWAEGREGVEKSSSALIETHTVRPEFARPFLFSRLREALRVACAQEPVFPCCGNGASACAVFLAAQNEFPSPPVEMESSDDEAFRACGKPDWVDPRR
jgi:hypothetical protein